MFIIDICVIDNDNTDYQNSEFTKSTFFVKIITNSNKGGRDMDKNTVSRATLSRLPRYLDALTGLCDKESVYVSATALAKMLSLGEVQVRKDLAAVSGKGKPKLGYDRQQLIERLRDCLGYNSLTSAVLVGAGKLGRALADYDGFEKFGVKITAAFDSNEQILNLGAKTKILPIGEFESFCKSRDIKIGIITVGEGSAQTVCDKMVDSGITAIWNFAPCKLDVPDGIILRNENLALSLAHLNKQLYNFN